jgi:Raf kinase inhibitor-like YbhB/YbcL family protein
MSSRRPPRLVALAVIALTGAGGALTACNDDGRDLRPPRPDQLGSVSTSSAPPVDTAGIPGDLPAFETVAPTLPATTALDPLSPALQAPWFDGAVIDVRHTCDGENASPLLSWSPAPAGTQEIAITAIDLDSPEVVHWTMAGIDALTTSISEAIPPNTPVQGLAYNGELGYQGPCPVAGATGRYEFRVHFLAQRIELGDGAFGADMYAAIVGSAFASAAVTGTYATA